MEFSLRYRRGKETPDSFENEMHDEKKLHKYTSHNESSQIRLFLLTALSLYGRILNLGYPAYITEIELEMSKQVNWYMARKFFIGMFPPLSSLINTGLSYFLGYYGDQELVYAGQHFSNFPLVGMRRVSALLGAMIVPLCYMTLCNLNHSQSTATLAALLLVLENGTITQSRYASPEVHVLFFSALTTWSWSVARKYASEGKPNVLLWQLATGLCIGFSISSKWTGVILFPIIWCSIAFEIWNDLTDNRNSLYTCVKKAYAYLFTVGAFPLWIYMLVFKIHFNIASGAGDHDLILSSQFRYSLKGNVFEPSQLGIAYGSQIVIKHNGSPGGFLHSHEKRFKGGSTQQEVTLYPYVDLNNIWTVHKTNELYNSSQPLEYVHHGDNIRLEHFPSSRKLHSHDERPQLSTKSEHHEVTAYGDKLTRDIQDYWSLVLLDDENNHIKDTNITWKSLNQSFRLFHIRGCAMISHEAYYNAPGEHQHQEVTCMVSAGIHISTWSVESAYHEKLEDKEYHSFPEIKFYEKLQQVHQLMFKYPSVVYDRLASQASAIDGTTNPKMNFPETPSRWFSKRTSLRFWYELSGSSVHLILNSAIQQFILISMTTCIGLLCTKAFLEKRQIKLSLNSWLDTTAMNLVKSESISFFYISTLLSVQGLRFLPHHILGLSDILPGIYYGVLLASTCFENMTSQLPSACRRLISYGLVGLALFRTLQYSHLIYGDEQWHRSQCEASGLEIQCIHFPLYPNELTELAQNSGQTPNATALTLYFGLLGKIESFRYEQGQEDRADESWALVKQSAYMKEAARLTGSYRYHRVEPTPAISLEDSIEWAKNVHADALLREKELAQERKKKRALKKKKRQAKKKNHGQRSRAE